MADKYLLETSATDGYLLEDGSGVLLLEGAAAADSRATMVLDADGGVMFISGG